MKNIKFKKIRDCMVGKVDGYEFVARGTDRVNMLYIYEENNNPYVNAICSYNRGIWDIKPDTEYDKSIATELIDYLENSILMPIYA